jgi:hypothetical protein
MEKYDISYGETGRVRMVFKPGKRGVVFKVPYNELDFFRWFYLDVLGKAKLPKLEKGAGRYEYKVILDRTSKTAFRWIALAEGRGLYLQRVIRDRGRGRGGKL